MSANRIQKLLFKEYSEFEDMVLIESPFAQTTRDGEGVRQVQMGLTPTKLILAVDVMSESRQPVVAAGSDPETESLELVSIVPVEAVNISVFRRRSRQALKARLCNDQVLYFELAASHKRQMFWNLWCERVKFLCPEEPKSTQSETSVGSSTSLSTVYVKVSGTVFRWEDRQLFVGSRTALGGAEEKTGGHARSTIRPATASSLHVVNRFGEGVAENCSTSLYLPLLPDSEDEDKLATEEREGDAQLKTQEEMWEEGVRGWEAGGRRGTSKHRRRYGLATLPHLLYALGPWPTTKHQSYSLQVKRVCSLVDLRSRFPLEAASGRRRPAPSASANALPHHARPTHTLSKCSIRFWTPERSLYNTQFSKTQFRVSLDSGDIRHENGGGRKRSMQYPWTIKNNTHMSFVKNEDRGGGGDGVHSLAERSPLRTWDMDSTALAYQMTIIERDLFLKVTVGELATLRWERSSVRAPHVSAVVAFSRRICNLVATEILSVEPIKMRARILARYINVADKLHRLNNMASCRSVLYGLQTPSVFRLKKTWAYVRHHHSTKYQRLGDLLRLHKDPRTGTYGRMWEAATRNPPYLPWIGRIVAALLGRLPPPTAHPLANRRDLWEAEEDGSMDGMSNAPSISGEGSLNSGVSGGSGWAVWRQSLAIMGAAARAYALADNNKAKQFILGARHLSEAENFALSKTLEPPSPKQTRSTTSGKEGVVKGQ